MFDQTSINRVSSIDWNSDADQTLRDHDLGRVRRLLADISELAELQVRLLSSDAKYLAESAIRPLQFYGVALVILAGATPVFLLSAANFLVDQFGWSVASAQLIAAGVALLVAGGFVAVANHGLKACGSPLRSSLAELDKNMGTLRQLLTGSDPLTAHLAEMERREREY